MHELQRIHETVADLLASGRRGLLLTVLATEGSTFRRRGARAVIADDAAITCMLSGGCVERDVAARAKAWLDGEPRIVTYDTSADEDIVFGLGLGCRGKMTILVEPFDAARPPRLPPVPSRDPIEWTTTFEGKVVLTESIGPARSIAIFGRGADVDPVAAIARTLGWTVDVIRSREMPPLDAYDAVIAMTHNFLHDVAIIEAALASPAAYVGVLGPRTRGEEILTQIGDVPPVARRRFRSPIGLDLGGEAPEDIALSIVAEIQMALSGRDARPLREVDGGIHDVRDATRLTGAGR